MKLCCGREYSFALKDNRNVANIIQLRLNAPKKVHQNLRGPICLAIPDSSSTIDVVNSASELIVRASEGSINGQGSHVSHFMQALHHALDAGNLYSTNHNVSLESLSSIEPGSFLQEVTSALPAFSNGDIDAASQGMSIAASLPWAEAFTFLSAPQASGLEALATLASQRLLTLQSLDPASFQTMHQSMDQLLAGLRDLLDNEAGSQAHALTSALVLGVQQLVSIARMEEAAGGPYSVEAMAEAQTAFQNAAKNTPIELEGLVAITMGVIALVLACVPKGTDLQQKGASDDLPPARYDPEALAAYFSKRPIQVVVRASEVVSKLVGFLLSIFADAKTGRWESSMAARAKELRQIVESMGATSIKIAQSFSTRVDMLPQKYLDELSRLQDNVPTFSTVEARVVLEDGLGRSVDSVFEWLSEEPLAAASLGQVYRGKLKREFGGGEVAVKVQRPGILESAALDIFLLRRAAGLLSKIPGMSDQWALTLDDWALRFFQEMDYQLEAYNTMTFQKNMSSLQAIVVATVYPELTSNKVIVSEWIVGQKLSDCKPADIRALTGVFLNCYLIQLMETGLLHADPHPGNLMRTEDGKLVILDFGLMTEVNENQRIGLVEFIAHLTMEDWDALFMDLVTLGFMPADMDPEAAQHVKPLLKQVMGKILHGGGLGKAGLDFTSLYLSLQGVAMSYQLCIPPYFTNVLRAFGTLEGIALKVDPDYSIVHECMPYLSRRLLTDNNPRMRTALRQLLYGDGQRLDVERLQSLISSFSNFSTCTSSSSTSSRSSAYAFEERVKGSTRFAAGSEGPVLNETMREALKVVFAKDGSYAQELIVEELVAVIDAMSREALSEALRLVLGSATAVTALRSVEALGPLRAMLLPLPLPMEMLHSMEPAVALTKEDRQALNTLRAILDLMQPSLMQGIPSVATAGRNTLRAAGEMVPMLPDLLPGVQVTVELFIRQLVRRMAIRLAEDLEPGKFGGAVVAPFHGGGSGSRPFGAAAASAPTPAPGKGPSWSRQQH
ncbi:hypothetical protein CEUSTIGMA_g10857.t1 [Chlamydomonas eustigma]|uniref:Protein kinase domain-containing protein n=1 Tax=Chlamydomonas eustigma TaxID=1157962 RepID=A0A250XKI0_9CHLO|nr:hypothetical protein CEUSTIGMA_g10857.t1 [Chlamydomonas eustigma]|eukprot:GAX83432.1 hypothetical protein CEUSTIGMA_g10857.t1 [Chlamydomonas eustigma]